MEYYGVRNGVLDLSDLKISFEQFRIYFLEIYDYFEEKNYFQLAFYGYKSTPRLMTPSHTAYLFNHVGNTNIFPLDRYGRRLDKVTLFILIEVLHKYIRKIEDFDMYDDLIAQSEFRNEINKYLVHLEDGYLLSDNGCVINLPENGLVNLIHTNLPMYTDDSVTEKVQTAIKMFYRYDSNMEQKRKAINILADVLEPNREYMKDITSNNHDSMIFHIVNKYGIRHNNLEQKEDYDKPIWYEWMFHYYLSTVHAALRLNKDFI